MANRKNGAVSHHLIGGHGTSERRNAASLQEKARLLIDLFRAWRALGLSRDEANAAARKLSREWGVR